jgi:hypothetical protein
MYGLPQAGRLSQLRLIEHLKKHGYIQFLNTPCLFSHLTRDVQFCLVVDDFGIKYGSRDDAEHLIKTLQSNGYQLTIKDKGNTYLGMDIAFTPSSVSISMPGDIEKMLQRFRPNYLLPSRSHPWKVHYTSFPSAVGFNTSKSMTRPHSLPPKPKNFKQSSAHCYTTPELLTQPSSLYYKLSY